MINRKGHFLLADRSAEGYGRSGNKEFVQFLANAKGSVAEAKSQLSIKPWNSETLEPHQ